MIKALASIFRGIHVAAGITAPPKDCPPETERKFVYMWLGFMVVIIGWAVLLAYWFSH